MQHLRNGSSRAIESLVAFALVSFASSARADFDDTEVLSLLVTVLGWPTVIAASAFAVGSRRPVIVMLLAAVLYPFTAYCLYLFAYRITEGLSLSYGAATQLTLVLLLIIWIAALIGLRQWAAVGTRDRASDKNGQDV